VSVGVGFMVGAQSGFTINASVSKGQGHTDGQDTAYSNTTVKAGNKITITSGGDTTLKGASLDAKQVTGDIGGNLSVESLQDKSTFDARQTSAGIGVSLCIPPICYGASSVSASYAKANGNGSYASVTAQSGIQAGDGGFQLKVNGNTDLKGGAIASSQAAIDHNQNSLKTATLTTSDLGNQDDHEATAFSVSATVSGQMGDQKSAAAQQGMTEAQKAQANQTGKPSGSAGIGHDAGSQSSTTRSGISAGAITITDEAAQKNLTGQNVSVIAGQGDLSIAGTTVNAASLSLQAAGTLHLNVQSTVQTTDKAAQGGDLGWQSVKDQGQKQETAEYNQFNTANLSVEATKIEVQVGQAPAAKPTPTAALAASLVPGAAAPIDPKASLQSSVDTLKTQPGLAWLGQLQTDPALKDKVDWQAVTQAHERWDFKQQGLTKEGAAIVTLVVAYFTAGAASGAGAVVGAAVDGAAVGGAAVAVGTTGAVAEASLTATVLAGATTAAVSTLGSQAAVALINNKGDIGGALHDLGSSDNVKGLVASIVTGGVLGGLDLNATGNATKSGGANTFVNQLGQNLQAGAAKAVINTAIYGTSLEDNLKQEIKGALISTSAAQTANAIGDAKLDAFANKAAHAIAGCVAGVAKTVGTGASKGDACSAGALGAAMGELSAEFYGAKDDTVQFSSMMGGISAAVTGQDVNTAAAAGGNAAANNNLTHWQKAARDAELAGCKTPICTAAVKLKYGGIDAMQNAGLVAGVGAGIGVQTVEQVAAIAELVKNLPETLNTLNAVISDPEFRSKVGASVVADYEARIDLLNRAYTDGGWDGSVTAGVEGGRLAVDLVGVATAAVRAGKLLSQIGKMAVVSTAKIEVALTDTAVAVKATNAFTTEVDRAVFWSGKTSGVGGVDVACTVATACGGTTLEQLMASKGIALPAWDVSDPVVVGAWQSASKSFAEGASGSVIAVVGKNLRPGNVWETIELPALKANANVIQITVVDHATGIKTIVFKR
jgi:Possible hemagglutinin (DUF637)/Hemagglutinin repeat